MGEKTEKIERIEKNKGRTMNEIIIDMEKGTGSSSKVSRILDSQTEVLAKRLERSNMEQLMAESERKRIEEENRLKAAQKGEMPPTPQPQQAPQEAKNILEAVKVGLEAGKPQKSEGSSIGEIVKGMADMFKTGVDVGRSSQPQQPQQNQLETMKTYHEMFLKPVLDQLNSKDKELMTMRMVQLENKITSQAQVSPKEYIKEIKESATILGLTGGGKSELDLKILEMQQNERSDNRKLDWEIQRHQEDKEGEKQLYGLIGKAIDGPIADLTKNLGSAAARRIGGVANNKPAQTNSSNPNLPPVIQIPCPSCGKQFGVIAGSPQVACPFCSAVLALAPTQQSEAPPAQQPETPPVQPAPEAQQP